MSRRTIDISGSIVPTGAFAAGVESQWVRVGDSRTFHRVAGAELIVGEERFVDDTKVIVEVDRRPMLVGVRLDQQ